MFRLVQASDLHFSTSPDVINPYDSDGALGALKELFGGPIGNGRTLLLSSFSPDMAGAFSCEIHDLSSEIDAVIVTGDLATTGFKEDLSAALNYFEGRIPTEWSPTEEAFSPLLGLEDYPPVVVMPGNHDRYESPSFHPGSVEFENAFGTYWNFSGPSPKRFDHHKCVRTTYLKKEPSILALCAVDFSLQNVNQADHLPFAYLGQGRVITRAHINEVMQPLDELVEQTVWIKENYPNAGIIWCVHFPPKFPNGEQKLRLIDEDLLLQRAKELGIELLLCGHTHKFDSYLVGGTRIVCCGSTTGTSSSHGNQYLELIVNTADMANPKVKQWQWTEKLGQFV